jgi:hypothetical protein
MPSGLETILRNYLMTWKPNAKGILFATKDGTRSRSRDNVVRVNLYWGSSVSQHPTLDSMPFDTD